MTDDACVRPPDFDLEAFWGEWSASFEASLPLVWVTVLVAPAALNRLRSLVDHRATSTTEWRATLDGRGRHRLTVGFENLDHAQAALLSLGPAVEVVDPPSLRDGIVMATRGILESYER
jgi:predicted DNA-binding transcriptional regulator YafY